MQKILSIIKALDNESRMRILQALRGGEVCLCHISAMLDLAPSTVSRHIELLRHAGLVEMRKEGRWHHYRLAGRNASPLVRDAIRWVDRALESEDVVIADAARLSAARTGSDDGMTSCKIPS